MPTASSSSRARPSSSGERLGDQLLGPEPALPQPHDPLDLCGTRVAGRLAVVNYLGATSVAHIYRVVHTLMHQACFLKLAPKIPSGDGLPPRMAREAQAVANLKHPAILRGLDAGVWGDWAYFAQEWSDGPNLRAIMNQGQDVRVPHLLALGLGLLDVLCALHREGAVLRCFEPERILLPPSGSGAVLVRLFDLSRLAYVGEVPQAPDPGTSHHSRRFMLRSARYMAPEEIQEAPADPRSDLYSFGLLLYELISGEYPYHARGKGPTAYVAGHLRDEPRPLKSQAQQPMPSDLPDVLRCLLSKRPEDRFETAEAARRALEDVVMPDLLRLNTPGERHVLEGWRSRVRNGLRATLSERPAAEE